MPRPRSVLLVPGLLVAGLLAGCGGGGDEEDAGRPVPVGTVLDTPGQVQGTGTFVQLPLGRVDLTVSAPQQRLPTYDETYDRAGEGDSLVGVGWSWDVASVVPGMLDPGQAEPEPSFSLLADGQRYPLDDAFLRRLDEEDTTGLTDRALDFDGSAWVAVEGVPETLEVEVVYDGLTQVVDPSDTGPRTDGGSADLLYGVTSRMAPQPLDCGPATVPGSADSGLGLEPYCQATLTELPYRQGFGWALAEDPWLVVDLTLGGGSSATWSGGGEQAVYSVEEIDAPTAGLDGASPAGTLTNPQDPTRTTMVLRQSSRGQVLQVESAVRTSGTGTPDAAPTDPTIPVTWSIEIP